MIKINNMKTLKVLFMFVKRVPTSNKRTLTLVNDNNIAYLIKKGVVMLLW